MKLSIEFIPHSEHRFTTIGHWFDDIDGITHIQISQELPWEYRVAVLFHELIEYSYCRSRGITTEECDEFDELFEKGYNDGVSKSLEAGLDPRCPYRRGHIWGCRFERLVIWILKEDWLEYDKACCRLMGFEP